MFYNNQTPISSQQYKKKLYDFFLLWRCGLSWSTTHAPFFFSGNITKNTETHPPPMRHVIIDQPHTELIIPVLNFSLVF